MSSSSNVTNPTLPANDKPAATPQPVPTAPAKETAPVETPTK
ncbi:hypothetical protein [Dongia sp.]